MPTAERLARQIAELDATRLTRSRAVLAEAARRIDAFMACQCG